jgi:hypothetical protein
MIDLTINVETLKGKLADYTGDALLAKGSSNCVLSLDIEKVMFKEQDIKNKDAKLKTVKDNLAIARQDCMEWLNNVEPKTAKIPQGFINYATLFASAIPQIRHELENESKSSRKILKSLFQGFNKNVSTQRDTLAGFLNTIKGTAAKLAIDADNFSESNQAFKELEDVDEKNFKTAQKVIANLSALIDQHNKDITAKMIKEEEDLTIADISIAAGGDIGHLWEPLEAIGLAVGLVFIVSAGLTIIELEGEIEEEFREAQKQVEYKLIITQLTEQLLCLHTASSSLHSLTDTITSLQADIEQILDHWNLIFDVNQSALTALDDDSQKLTDIFSEFNLGRASAEWEEVNNFSLKMQDLPISQMSQKLTTIPPQKPE